jgi:hypothetical protein
MSVENKDEPGGQFAQLLNDLDVLAKAQPAPIADDDEDGDKKIADAAADGAPAPDADGKKAPVMAKSMTVTLPDGSQVEAEDGTELVKALQEQVSGLEGTMAKALGAAVALIKTQGETLAATNNLVKSLQTRVAELSNQGAPRKSMLTVHEKPAGTMAKSEQPGMTAPEFMAKSEAAWKAGKITGQDFTTIDVSLRSREPIDPGLIQKVMA